MRKLKHIFDRKLRSGDIVIHTVSEDTVEYVSPYETGLTSIVRHRGSTSIPFLAPDKNIVKFRSYMVCEWIGERASVLNKRLGRYVSAI